MAGGDGADGGGGGGTEGWAAWRGAGGAATGRSDGRVHMSSANVTMTNAFVKKPRHRKEPRFICSRRGMSSLERMALRSARFEQPSNFLRWNWFL